VPETVGHRELVWLVANLTGPPVNARRRETGRRAFRVYLLSCNGLRQSARWRRTLRFERDEQSFGPKLSESLIGFTVAG
jgi:hypothetical protein